MPDLLEAPRQSRHLPDAAKPFTFTDHARASAAGKRSGELRRLRAAQLLTADKPPAFDSVQATVNGQLELVAGQIKRTRDLLDDDEYRYCEHCERGGMEPNHRAQLLRSFATLLEQQRKLLGIGDPAPRKAERNGRVSAGWIELQPALPVGPVGPAPPAAATDVTCCAPARPPGWEYQDPPGYVREPVTEPSPPKTD